VEVDIHVVRRELALTALILGASEHRSIGNGGLQWLESWTVQWCSPSGAANKTDVVKDGFQLSLGADASTSYSSATAPSIVPPSAFRLSSPGVPQFFYHEFVFVEKKKVELGKRKLPIIMGAPMLAS
jgi:hypothetical protein